MSGRGSGEVRLVSSSPEETEAFGALLAEGLVEGDVVSVVGELGAGKTRFVAGILRGLGVSGGGQSPSFVVERRYQGRVLACHLDLYRIEGRRALQEIGVPDRFDEGGVHLVEWGDRAAGLLPAERTEVAIGDEGGGRRAIRVRGPARAVAALDAAAGRR